MKALKQLILYSIEWFSKLKTQRIMSSISEPTAHKRAKISEEECGDSQKASTDESDVWRSKLGRSFDEIDVGITEFIDNYKPFEAVLKNRYEDFLVHEISKSGQIVRLTDNSRPEEEVVPVLDVYEVLDDNTIEQIRHLLALDQKLINESTDEIIDETIDCEVIAEEVNDSEVISDEVKSKSTEEEMDSNEQKEGSNGKDCQNESVVKISVNGLSKQERTRIHKAIKDNYEELETSTIDEESNKYILVKKVDKNGPKRRASQWPKDKGEYIHFVLYKENKETQQAINELALKMYISGKNFNTAGTKDKRAITTQMVSAWKVPPKKIWAAAAKCSGVEVGHFRFDKNIINLGDLNGNQFDIVLRDVKCNDREDAEQSLKAVQTNGFINYYGMQRFGYQHSKPYSIGVFILRQNWEQVVQTILSPKPQDIRFHNKPNALSFNECIDLWRTTRNAQLVYKKLPFKWTPEGTLLKGLTRVNENDFHGAICTGMARNQRLLYLHCYQSYIWNKSVSFRVKTYGLRVVAGDLLLMTDKSKDSDNEIKAKDMNSHVVIADQNNMSLASIYDIVLPVIGNDSLFPNNSVRDYMQSLLAEDQITIDMYRNLPKQWCVFGTYRKVFVRPEQFEYEWIGYKDPNIPLIESDFNIIKRNSVSDNQSIAETHFKTELQTKVINNSEANESEKLALKLSVRLPVSTYATMLCRQITRTETTILENKSWLKSRYNV